MVFRKYTFGLIEEIPRETTGRNWQRTFWPGKKNDTLTAKDPEQWIWGSGVWGSTGSLESGRMQGPNHIGSGTSLRIRGSRGLLWGSRVWVHKARATDFRSGTALTRGLVVYSGGLESGGLLWGSGVWGSTGPETLILDLEQHTPNCKQNYTGPLLLWNLGSAPASATPLAHPQPCRHVVFAALPLFSGPAESLAPASA